MDAPLEVVVGLGNPGPRYEATRHNAGFWFADRLADRTGAELRPDNRSQGDLGRIEMGERTAWLLKPATWMNHSGRSVASLVNYYRLRPDQVLVAYDELDLPPGAVKLKTGGGHGGHNGLRDTIAALGSPDFHRLRIGIGHPGQRELVTPWVLSKPEPGDRDAIRDAIERAIDVLPLAIAGDIGEAMKHLHTRKSETDDPSP